MYTLCDNSMLTRRDTTFRLHLSNYQSNEKFDPYSVGKRVAAIEQFRGHKLCKVTTTEG